MDKKIMYAIIAVVAVVIVAAVAVVALNDDDDGNDTPKYEMAVDSGSTIDSFSDYTDANATGTKIVSVNINITDGNDANVTVSHDAIEDLSETGYGLNLIVNKNTVTISADDLKKADTEGNDVKFTVDVSTDTSKITEKIGEKYSEARAVATVNVDGTTSIKDVEVSIPYKLNSDMKETAERATYWDSALATHQATYENGTATINAAVGSPSYLAFMSAEDSAYYPVTYETQIGKEVIEQTLTHKPYSVVTLWDSSTELAILFGLTDSITFAYASADYKCLNTDLQPVYDKLDTKKTYDSGITASLENIRAADPDLIIGWSSSFVDGAWGIGLPSVWNDRGTACMTCNRPSNSLDDYYTILNNMGIACNMMDKSNELVGQFKDSVASFETKLTNAGISDDKKHTGLIIETGYGDNGTDAFVYGASFLTGDLITKAGGVNLATGGMEKMTAEQILNLALPDGEDKIDTIILFIKNPDGADATVKDFKNTPAYKTLGESANVYAFEFAQLYMGGVMQQDILDVIFGCLYPDLKE